MLGMTVTLAGGDVEVEWVRTTIADDRHSRQPKEMKSVAVTALVQNFADACRALIPSMETVDVAWKDAEQYDGWDRVAEALFETLVLEPCRYQAIARGLREPRFPQYGFEYHYGEHTAFIEIEGNSHPTCQFIQLASIDLPFDHIVGEGSPDRIVIPLAVTTLQCVIVNAPGETWAFRSIDLHH
jgi:hypothetical protein